MSYQLLEQQFTTWAESQPDVLAVMVIGSRGRVQPPPDEYSDLDLFLWTENAHSYKVNDQWLHQFGEHILTFFSHTGKGLPEWEIIFANGTKLDVVIIEAQFCPLAELLRDFPHTAALQRGFRILVNKYGDHVDGSSWSFAAAISPDQYQFDHLVKELLLETTRALKFAQRGDLWRAKMLCDGVMKKHLLTLLEWQAVAKYSQDLDVWYDGRYLEWWADPSALSALPGTFATYEAKDIIRALHATVSLGHWLAEDVAQRNNLTYSPKATLTILHWLTVAHKPKPVAPLHEDL